MSRTSTTAAPAIPGVVVACAGCGGVVGPEVAFPVRCPAAVAGDGIDHLLTRRIDLTGVRFVADDDPNPFVRYRELLRSWHVARAARWSDERFIGLVHRLDREIAAIDGHGFRVTPFDRADALSDALGFDERGGVWVKDETGNVGGSHKARHLMGIMLELLVAETLDPSLESRPLAIASCGNAALAAAIVAHAAERRLDVFVPPDADPVVLERLGHLHARVEVVARTGVGPGDPTVERLRAAIDLGAIPFTCQGPENGLAIEGGQTLAWELAEAVAREGIGLQRLVVQVGGGALASACAAGLDEALALGVIDGLPRFDTVQTLGAWPLRRAWERLTDELRDRGVDPTLPGDLERPVVRDVLDAAARDRARYMWPWETAPHSVAHGILDDETYDWLAVVRAMVRTGGVPLVIDEATLVAANRLAARATGTAADETGTAGLAGLLDLRTTDDVRPDERVAVLFTGIRRGGPTPEWSA